MPSNISAHPFHICSQFPVNNPANTSNNPVSTSSAPPRTAAIASNVLVNTGARKSHNVFQMVVTTSLKFSKSNPIAFNRSTMPCPNESNFALISSQVAITLLRNSSFVFHKCMNAATSTPITATTARIGADNPPRTPPNAPAPLVNADIAPVTPDSTLNSGEIAAVSAKTPAIMVKVVGDIFLNASRTFSIASLIAGIYGMIASAISTPNDAIVGNTSAFS